MEGVRLKKIKLDPSFDLEMCIICQEDTGEKVISEGKGRAQVKDAVKDRLEIIVDGDFNNHSINKCYKYYTYKRKLAKLRKEKGASKK